MRLVFWLFLLLNAAFFYWQFSQPEKSDPLLLPVEDMPVGVESLVLLRERGLGAQLVKQEQNPTDVKKVAVESDVDQVSVERPKQVVATPTAATQAESVTETETTPHPSVGSEKEEPTVTPVSEPVANVTLACFTLGPFKDEAGAGKMYKALLPLGIDIKQRLSERRIPKNYWVYLPPQKSYADARKKVKNLEAKGLDDMFIMGAGKMKNAVSLGLFKRKSMAISRFNEVRTLDSSTVMKPKYQLVTEKWLDLIVDGASTETVARLAELADEQPGIALQQQKSCK